MPEYETSFLEIGDLKSIEKQVKRNAHFEKRLFVSDARRQLQRLAGYPNGLPQAKDLQINRTLWLPGETVDNYVRIWMSGYRGPRLLHCLIRTDNLTEFSVMTKTQNFAIQAYDGNTYVFKTRQSFHEQDDIHQPHQQLRYIARIGIRGSIPEDSSITNLSEHVGRYSLFEEMQTRQDLEDTWLPFLQSLTPDQFIDDPRTLI